MPAKKHPIYKPVCITGEKRAPDGTISKGEFQEVDIEYLLDATQEYFDDKPYKLIIDYSK